MSENPPFGPAWELARDLLTKGYSVGSVQQRVRHKTGKTIGLNQLSGLKAAMTRHHGLDVETIEDPDWTPRPERHDPLLAAIRREHPHIVRHLTGRRVA